MTHVHVINGPNLNLLGTREPEVYGTETLRDVEDRCGETAVALGLDLDFRQSNHEGEIVGWLHEVGRAVVDHASVGAVLNPGAYTHTSVAIADAIAGAQVPVIEVHLSNLHAREGFRRHSYVSPVARGLIVGLGPLGYDLAVRALSTLREV